MADFSLYQWLVLGLLSLIAFLIWAVGTGIERDLKDVTQRIEMAVETIRQEITKISQPSDPSPTV